MNKNKLNNIKKIKWYGWGDPEKSYPLNDKPDLIPFIKKELGIEEILNNTLVDINMIQIPESRVNIDLLNTLKDIVDEDNISVEKIDRITHSYGKSYCDLIRIRNGEIIKSPDIIVYPGSHREVERIIELANKLNIVVIPFGGGSGVLGGVEIDPNENRLIMSLDLMRLNRIIKINKDSMTATIEAGIYGPDLEYYLNKEGFTLGHFPQSFEFSTLGGWVATRSAGQNSTKYGKIEDMILALKTVTPGGTIETKITPASATGPDLKHLLVGSEGIYGIITEVTVKIHPIPEVCEYYGFLFKNYNDGIKVIKEILQAGINPAVIRLSDSEETRNSLKLKGKSKSITKNMIHSIAKWYLKNIFGYSFETGSLMIIGFEGDKKSVNFEKNISLKICKKYKGFNLGTSVGNHWKKTRFELPYLRDNLLDMGIMVDTLETATTWTNIENLYNNIKKSILDAISQTGVKGIVFCHISHSYKTGASLYFTFLAPQNKEPIKQWLEIKKIVTDCIMNNNGTLSHHHGVGKDHAPWLIEEIGEHGIEILKNLKNNIDPNNIMNPGKLINYIDIYK